MMTTTEEPRHVASPAARLLHFNFRFAELHHVDYSVVSQFEIKGA